MNKSSLATKKQKRSTSLPKPAKKSISKKKSILHSPKRSFASEVGSGSEGSGSDVSSDDTPEPLPISKRKSTPWNIRNPHANDTMVEEDRDKINTFLEPLGLGNYKEKFTSFDQVLMTKTALLKTEFGMNCKERKLLRKHANYFRVGHYYKTGEVYQPKYEFRQPTNPGRYHRDATSEDEITFVLPAKDGLYRAHLRYPGSSFRENYLIRTYNEDRFFIHNSPSARLSPEQQEEVASAFRRRGVPVPESARPGGTGADFVDSSSTDDI